MSQGDAVTLADRVHPNRLRANPRGVVLAALYPAWAFALAFLGQPVLGPLSGLVLLELALSGYRRLVLRGNVVNDPALRARVAKPLQELCRQAEVAAPPVVILSNSLRPMAVAKRKGPCPSRCISAVLGRSR